MSLAAECKDQLDKADAQRDVAESHEYLIGDVPFQFRKFVEAVHKIQGKEDNSEEFDAATNEAVTQIAEQKYCRIGTGDMGPCRDDKGCDNHLLDVTEHFL